MIDWFLTRILQKKALKKIVNPHKGRYVSLSDAQMVGFIVNAEIPGSAEAVNELKWVLQERKINYKGIILPYIDFVKERYTKYGIPNLFAEKQEGQACLLVKGQAGKQALCCTLKKE